MNIVKLEGSDGITIAKELLNQIDAEWNCLSKINFISCDNAATNSGRFLGAITCLEELIEEKLGISKRFIVLWCRHHIYEIFFSKVIKAYFPGTDGPTLPVFRRFRSRFPELDSGNLSAYEGESFSDLEKVNLLAFFDHQLALNHSRADYKDLIYKAKLFLFAHLEETPVFRKPPAVSNSRWMVQLIYFFDIYLLRNQFRFNEFPITTVEKICIFSIKCYLEPWMHCSLPERAPLDDLTFLQKVSNYPDCKIVKPLKSSILKHSDYLVKIVFLALIDDRIDHQTKRRMVYNLQNKDPEDVILDDDQDISELFSTDVLSDLESLNFNLDFLNNDVED